MTTIGIVSKEGKPGRWHYGVAFDGAEKLKSDRRHGFESKVAADAAGNGYLDLIREEGAAALRIVSDTLLRDTVRDSREATASARREGEKTGKAAGRKEARRSMLWGLAIALLFGGIVGASIGSI